MAREQRRLGAVPRALLGHAAARVALRRRPVARRLRGLARGDPRARRHATGRPAPPLHRRGGAALRGVRRRDAARAGPDRRLVGLRLHAVRPVARPVREPGGVRAALPGELHLRGARPDARLVLLAPRRVRAAVRPLVLRDVPLPGADPGRRGSEDVEVEGQRGRAVGRARHARRGRLPLVLLHLEAALGRLPLLARDGRRVGASVPEAALEHVRVLRPVRERERARGGVARDRARPVDPLAPGRDHRARHGADGGLRHHVRRPGDRRIRRRPLELVRAPVAPALLGRRSGRLRDAGRVPPHHGEAPRPAHPVRGRRDLREPGRQRALRAHMRLPRAGRARPRPRVEHAGHARRRRAGARGPGPRAAEGAPAAGRGGRRGGGPRARGHRGARGPAHRGAEREVRALRVRGRRAGPLRAEAQLPHARAALRKADAAGGRGGGVARSVTDPCGGNGRDQHRRPGAPDRPGRRPGGATAARGLPGGALRHARGGAKPGARRHAAARGTRARGGARRAGGAQGGRPQRRGPDRAGARRRRGAARRRPRPRGVRGRGDSRHLGQLRRRGRPMPQPPRSRAAAC